MHTPLRRTLGCLLTITLILSGICLLNNRLSRPEAREKYADFYNLETDVDVLILGSSHAMRAISPMELWEEYGITSYNLASSGCRLASSYWVLRNALQYTSPSLVVVDCAYLQDVKANPNTQYGHQIFDLMPLGRVKVEALRDLYPDPADFMELIFPFSVYHNRWEEIRPASLLRTYSSKGAMGFLPEWTMADKKLTTFTAPQAVPVENVSTQYLEKIVQTCRDASIQVLMMTVPYWEDETSLNDTAWIKELAASWGVPYLTPEEIYSWLEPHTDFSNQYENNSHLNWKGALAMSHEIGPLLQTFSGVEDHSADPAYESWNENLAAYRAYKLDTLRKITRNVRSYLLMAADPHYRTEVEIYNPKVPKSKKYKYLLKSLRKNNISSKQTVAENGPEDKRLRIRVYDADGELLDEKTF